MQCIFYLAIQFYKNQIIAFFLQSLHVNDKTLENISFMWISCNLKG